MAQKQQFTELLKRIDDSTNAIGQQLKDYADQIKNGGLSAVDEDQLVADLTAAADKLSAVGKEAPPEPAAGEDPTEDNEEFPDESKDEPKNP